MVEIFQDIRYYHDFASPCAELADYVEFFAECSATRLQADFGTGPVRLTMFASWTPTFFINLGSAYALNLGHTCHQVPAGHDVLVLRNGPVTRYNQSTDNVFTVKFYPGGLEAVLGISQVPLADELVDLRRLLPPALLARLKQPLAFAERVQLMQNHLLQAGRPASRQDHYQQLVHDAIGEYAGSGLLLSTNEVAERVFLTSKTLNRYFHRVVGTSPKQYFSVLRARTALTAYLAQPDDFAPFEYGYFDRSHFDKAVRQFTGHRPAGWG